MFIGSDIISKMGINILYHCFIRDSVYIRLKLEDEISNGMYYKQLYNMMYTIFPILQKIEEDQGCILDANYTKVNIDNTVDSLDIQQLSKKALKATLKKYSTCLVVVLVCQISSLSQLN